MSLLEIKNLYKSFGGLGAVINFNFTIQSGELIGLIGPNGAGKTTVFNLITGVYRPDKGQILLQGQNIAGLPPYTICQKGIARTFQNIRLFKDLSVIDNVKIAFHKNVDYSLFSTLRPSGTWEIPRATIFSGAILSSSCPLNNMLPELGRRIPDMLFRVVVFPAPLAPIKVTILPSATSKDKFFRAWIAP